MKLLSKKEILSNLLPWQVDVLLSQAKVKVLLCGRQVGKMEALTNIIPTPDGYTTIGDLKVGDIIFGSDGRPVTVTYLTPIQYDKPAYNVNFSTGESIIVGGEHLWSVRDKKRKVNRGINQNHYEVVSTEYMLKKGLNTHSSKKDCRFSVPTCLPIQGKETNLPIDPYILGYWLGDGNSNSFVITVHKDDLQNLCKNIDKTNLDYVIKKYKSVSGDVFTVRIKLPVSRLKELNLYKNKHIPLQYLRSSLNQRLELIQGLMDSDGSVDIEGSCEITFKSEQLINDTHELLSTLGIRLHKPKNKIVNGTVYNRLSFTAYREDFELFNLPRKLERQQYSPHNSRRYSTKKRQIVSIIRTEPVPMRCLTVDAKDHLYLTSKSFIPTHNTSLIGTYCYNQALSMSNREILVCAVTHKQVKENLFRPLLTSADPLFPKEVITKLNLTDLSVELINGSRITFSGTESVDNLLGRTVTDLLLDEYQSMDPNVWTRLQPMLAANNGNVIFSGTARGFDHLYNEWWKGTLQNPNRTKHYRSWKIPTPNCGTPAGEPVAIELAKSTLSKVQYEQEYEANPKSLKGVVYGNFSNELNLSTLPLDITKPLLIGMDYNVSNLCVAIGQKHIVTENGKNIVQLHIVEEICEENFDTHRMAALLSARYPQFKGKIHIYPDPAGNARKTSAVHNSTDHSIMRSVGTLFFHNKAPLIADRVNATNALFCNANNQRRLFVNAKCTQLIKALMSQTYTSEGQPAKGGTPDFSNNIDSIGYMCEYLFPIGGSTMQQGNMYGYK